MDEVKPNNKYQSNYNIVALIAFVTMWMPFVGPILGIVALVQIRKTHEKGRWMAVSSIVLPIIATIIFCLAIFFLIRSAINDTQQKAQSLNVSTSEYNQINNAINGSCTIDRITTGEWTNPDDYSSTKSSSILVVKQGFASGYRQCQGSDGESSYFIAKKDNPLNENSTWRLIYAGTPYPPCFIREDYGIPDSFMTVCDESQQKNLPDSSL